MLANLLAAESRAVRERIENYLNKMRSVQTVLTGDELKALGINSGPRIKEILELLLEAQLDGRVKTREEEIEMLGKMNKAVK